MKDEVLKLALDVLEKGKFYARTLMMNQNPFESAITAIKEALAQPSDSVEQEPVAWRIWNGGLQDDFNVYLYSEDGDGEPLYTTPPNREWVGLTEDERTYALQFSKALAIMHIEAKLKEKNFDDKTASK